jgi:ABC-type glycerol-3-phosphate transport system permease component
LANPAGIARYHAGYGRRFAGSVLVTILILIGYIARQKHLVNGSTAGAPKG